MAQTGRSAGPAGRNVTRGAPVILGFRSQSRGPRPLGGALLADGALQLGLHEGVEVAVEDGPGVARLVVRPQVLDHLVRMQDIAPDLVAPAGLDVLALERADLLLLLLERALEQPGLEDLD